MTELNPLAKKFYDYFMEDPEAHEEFMGKVLNYAPGRVGRDFIGFLHDELQDLSDAVSDAPGVKDPWGMMEFVQSICGDPDRETAEQLGAAILKAWTARH
jgi:hypothetical protein